MESAWFPQKDGTDPNLTNIPQITGQGHQNIAVIERNIFSEHSLITLSISLNIACLSFKVTFFCPDMKSARGHCLTTRMAPLPTLAPVDTWIRTPQLLNHAIVSNFYANTSLVNPDILAPVRNRLETTSKR